MAIGRQWRVPLSTPQTQQQEQRQMCRRSRPRQRRCRQRRSRRTRSTACANRVQHHSRSDAEVQHRYYSTVQYSTEQSVTHGMVQWNGVVACVLFRVVHVPSAGSAASSPRSSLRHPARRPPASASAGAMPPVGAPAPANVPISEHMVSRITTTHG